MVELTPCFNYNPIPIAQNTDKIAGDGRQKSTQRHQCKFYLLKLLSLQ